eukprot:TRINITY_DN14165_c0_g5_i1.p1 TRINITY_DN14165_c0_g5~~TRINITY_DN14165_c0_g5_i1.p1  ORF type:complete len:916 (+),score=241.04 TRINITY_DN14165_c0_g5_i1:255-2750(+)
MCSQDRRKEANRLLTDELAVFQTSAAYASKAAEARLLLALAEVNWDRRGQKKREEALKFAGQARGHAVELGAVGLEASALLMMAKIFNKFKGEKNACLRESYRLAEQGLQLFKDTEDVRGQASASHWLGVAQHHLKELVTAVQCMQDAAELWRQSQDVIMEAQSLSFAAAWEIECVRPQRAVASAERALALYRQAEVGYGRESQALQTLVSAQIFNGEPWRAIWTAEEAVARFREQRQKRGEALALILLAEGYIHSPTGKEESQERSYQTGKPPPPPPEAIAASQRAVRIARELEDSVLEAQLMSKLSNLHVKRTEMEEAIFAAHDALSHHKEVKGTDYKIVAMDSLVKAHLHQGNTHEADRAARAGRDISQRNQRWDGDASMLLAQAKVYAAEGKLEDALEAAREAQGLYHEHEDRMGEAKSMLQQADLKAVMKDYQQALRGAERAAELFERFGDEYNTSKALLLAAQCRSELLAKQRQTISKKPGRQGQKAPLPWEDLAKATKSSKQAAEAARKAKDASGEAAALVVVAQVMMFNGANSDEVMAVLEEALLLAVEADDARSEAQALSLQAQVHLDAGELQKSVRAAKQAEMLFRQGGELDGLRQVTEVLDKLRGFEFRVDDAPVRALSGAAAAAQAAMPQIAYGPDPKEVRAMIQEVTKKMVGSDNDIEDDLPLMDVGINSMNAVVFRNKLLSEFPGIELPTTLVFDFPSVRALSAYATELSTAMAMAAAPLLSPAAMSTASLARGPLAPAVDPAAVAAKIQEVARGMLGNGTDIDADMPLMDVGINSMNAVLFRNKLGAAFEGVELPSTLVFDYPTIKAMSELLSFSE